MKQTFPIPALTAAEIEHGGFVPVITAKQTNGTIPDVSTSIFDSLVKFKSDNIENVAVTVDIPNREYEKEVTRSVGEMGGEIQMTTSEVVSQPWDWKAEEAQNAKQAKSLAKFFLALIAALIVIAGLSLILN